MYEENQKSFLVFQIPNWFFISVEQWTFIDCVSLWQTFIFNFIHPGETCCRSCSSWGRYRAIFVHKFYTTWSEAVEWGSIQWSHKISCIMANASPVTHYQGHAFQQELSFDNFSFFIMFIWPFGSNLTQYTRNPFQKVGSTNSETPNSELTHPVKEKCNFTLPGQLFWVSLINSSRLTLCAPWL